MKKLLIFVNVILVFLLALSLWGAFAGGEEVKLEVGKKKNRSKTAAETAAPAPARFKVPASEEAAAVIVRKNVFDTQRTGGMAAGRGGTTYSLVGIYRVNKTQGAIIMSKGGVRRGNMPVKQFYRVGETLPNGYTLSEINGNQAVLMRGASRMTLDMAFASESNTTRTAARPNNNNPMQQMLNLMQQSIGMQQRQQMNMMRMMQNNNSSNRSGSNTSRGSTNRRSR